MEKSSHSPIRIAVVIALICIGGFSLRLQGLGVKSISHPEVYIPGIPLVPDISEPPPRHHLGFLLSWHFHDEPHPIGYYVAMFEWTKLFGTSEVALRFPSVALGALSIFLIFLVGRNLFGAATGLMAAFLLALHGFHIHWSQVARMYVPGAFLGLLSTWLLLKLIEAREPRPMLEICYLVVAAAGAETVEFFLPFLVVQVAWLFLAQLEARPLSWNTLIRPTPSTAHRLVQVQSMALMLCGPSLSHSICRGRQGAGWPPTLSFLGQYFGFGFLYAPDKFAMPYLELPAPLLWLLVLAALFLIGLSTFKRVDPPTPPASLKPIAFGYNLLCSVFASGVMAWYAVIAVWRNRGMAVLSVLPLLALFIPRLMVLGSALVTRFLPGLLPFSKRLKHPAILISFLAVIPTLVLFVASFRTSVIAPRAFLLFVPYLLLLVAAGAVAVGERFGSRPEIATIALLIAIFAGSWFYSAKKPDSPRDYKSLAHRILAVSQRDDLFFIRKRSWADTPIEYYLPTVNYVAEDYAQALADHPDARVWVIYWPDLTVGWTAEQARADRLQALDGYQKILTVRALRSQADLYRRRPAP